VALANAAIIAGNAEVVVCYRAMNERSRQRFGQPRVKPGIPTGLADSWQIDSSWTMPFGMVTAASYVAQTAQRYLHEYNATSEAFGRVAVNQRNYAQTNPNAYFNGRPITLEEHQDSRMIADPLHLLDCCQESDGAVALVIMSLERARDLRQTPIQVLAAAQGIGAEQHAMATVYRENIAQTLETKVVGDQLWKRSGLAPADMDVANLYDHFSCAVVMQLEALGFCRWGEAPGLIQDGGLALDGVIPTNTNGGQLSEAYIHGFNGMAEMVRQLRGTAANQVPGARLGVVTSGSHVPTSGVVLGRAD
jgi:acetyl-CoA acetyltransferase